MKERLRRYGKVVNCYGENMAFRCDSALEVVLQMLVDDGVHSRGHRENLLNDEFRCCGGFSGLYKNKYQVTCIDYAGSFVKAGDADPIERIMESFLKEKVAFKSKPIDCVGWKQKSKIKL